MSEQSEQAFYNSTERGDNIKEKETAVSLNKESPVPPVRTVRDRSLEDF